MKRGSYREGKEREKGGCREAKDSETVRRKLRYGKLKGRQEQEGPG